MEYILFGSTSETANQLFVFLGIYLLRLLLDAAPVLTNPEVQSLATASTIGYPAVLILIVFLEPLTDAILLVNGQNVPLAKTKINLTPSGIASFISKIVNIGITSTAAESALMDAFGTAKNDPKYQSKLKETTVGGTTNLELLPLDYRAHCLLLMLIAPTEEEQLARIKNIIQMESLYYYKKNKGYEPFKLTEAYTFINSEVEVKVKNFMPLPTLSTDTLFTAKRQLLRGY